MRLISFWSLTLFTSLLCLGQQLEFLGSTTFNNSGGTRIEVVQNKSDLVVFQFHEERHFDKRHISIHHFDSLLSHKSISSFSYSGGYHAKALTRALSYKNDSIFLMLEFEDEININDSLIYFNGFFDPKEY